MSNTATYQVRGTSKTLKRFANVDDTIVAIKRIIAQNYIAVAELAHSLKADTQAQTFENIWEYVRENIQYKNDAKGVEQLRTPQRTMHDRIGDCDDFSILISAILTNLNIRHELTVAAYKSKNDWQHIYPVAYDTNGNRYVIDCVPEIPYFNYEAKPIKNKIIIHMPSQMVLLKENNMKLEELNGVDDSTAIEELTEPFNLDGLGSADTEDEEIMEIQGLLGNVAIVDEDEEYDTVLSGSELHRNLILRQLIDAKKTLTKEISDPTEISQFSQVKQDLKHINNIIDSFDDEEEFQEAVNDAINSGSLYKNFYKTIDYAVKDSLNGLSGDDEDDVFYLKAMDDNGMLDQLLAEDDLENLEGLGELGWAWFKKLKNKIKKGVKKLKKKFPKIAKIAHAFKKFSPSTFGIRRSIEIFMRANAMQLASKIALGYASESQAKRLGYNKSEWLKFVSGKNKAESRWYSLGGKKSYFKKMIMSGRGAKAIGLKGFDGMDLGELGIAPAVIAAVAKVFGAIIGFFKKLKLKKKQAAEAKAKAAAAQKSASAPYPSNDDVYVEPGATKSTSTGGDSGVTEEIVTDENGKETTIYKDKDGKEIGKFKAFFLKHKKMIIIISIVTVVGIIAFIIWKIRQRNLHGLEGTGLSRKQENYIRRQGLNNRAYASLVREEIHRDKKKVNKTNRKIYYKKVFRDAFSRPISQKQVTATLNHNDRLKQVRTLAKQNGGGSAGWRKAWAEVKKKR